MQPYFRFAFTQTSKVLRIPHFLALPERTYPDPHFNNQIQLISNNIINC